MFRHTVIRRGARAVVVAVALGLFFTAPPAQAETKTAPPTLSIDATPNTSGKLVAHVKVEMKYDCAGMTGEALKTAIAQGNCPSGGATTNGTTVGNCGSSWVDVFGDFPLDGLGRVVWGMTSYQAPIFTRNLILNYTFDTIDQGWARRPSLRARSRILPEEKAGSTPLRRALSIALRRLDMCWRLPYQSSCCSYAKIRLPG
jgi:hypothetical protein